MIVNKCKECGQVFFLEEGLSLCSTCDQPLSFWCETHSQGPQGILGLKDGKPFCPSCEEAARTQAKPRKAAARKPVPAPPAPEPAPGPKPAPKPTPAPKPVAIPVPVPVPLPPPAPPPPVPSRRLGSLMKAFLVLLVLGLAGLGSTLRRKPLPAAAPLDPPAPAAVPTPPVPRDWTPQPVVLPELPPEDQPEERTSALQAALNAGLEARNLGLAQQLLAMLEPLDPVLAATRQPLVAALAQDLQEVERRGRIADLVQGVRYDLAVAQFPEAILKMQTLEEMDAEAAEPLKAELKLARYVKAEQRWLAPADSMLREAEDHLTAGRISQAAAIFTTLDKRFHQAWTFRRSGRLRLMVLDARDLPRVAAGPAGTTLPDPYLLVRQGTRILAVGRQQEATTSASWNESVRIDTTGADPAAIVILDRRRLGPDQPILSLPLPGPLALGLFSWRSGPCEIRFAVLPDGPLWTEGLPRRR